MSKSSKTVTYHKVEDLVAYMGGLINICLIGVGLIAKFYNTICCEISVANEIYDFDFSRDHKKHKNKFVNDACLVIDKQKSRS